MDYKRYKDEGYRAALYHPRCVPGMGATSVIEAWHLWERIDGRLRRVGTAHTFEDADAFFFGSNKCVSNKHR